MSDDDTRPQYSVVQFFPDGSYEYVARWIMPEAAVRLAKRITETIGAKLGTTTRVIITDGGDSTVFEWQHGRGVTFPPTRGDP
jgi:hypothetical protein